MRRQLLLILVIAACAKNEAHVEDAGADLASTDTPPPLTDIPVSLAVDFAVENCPSFDPVALTCTGTVPLAVRFVPLATTTVTKYLWQFGDNTSVAEAAPSHVYATPGLYTVRIIATGVGGGVVIQSHTGFIVAQPNPLGSACNADVQCEPGLFCVCPAGVDCPTGPPRGMCTSNCESSRCEAGQVCAGLRTAEPPEDVSEPWQASLCLLSCETDADCKAGLHCRTLPPGPSGTAWVRACFSDTPRDVGEPCTDTRENRRDDLCATGFCANFGVRGMCSMDCNFSSCPPGSDCLQFGDDRMLCLRPCSGVSTFACDRDFLLECIGPSPGSLGYRLPQDTNTSGASSYCAPKACSSDDRCLPTGTCTPSPGSGHCVPR
jgi:PKD repeat protein